jgi:hypothetical protein
MKQQGHEQDDNPPEYVDGHENDGSVRTVDEAAKEGGKNQNGEMAEKRELQELKTRTRRDLSDHPHDGKLVETVAKQRDELCDGEGEKTDFDEG